mgnify:CR=1 FL=1
MPRSHDHGHSISITSPEILHRHRFYRRAIGGGYAQKENHVLDVLAPRTVGAHQADRDRRHRPRDRDRSRDHRQLALGRRARRAVRGPGIRLRCRHRPHRHGRAVRALAIGRRGSAPMSSVKRRGRVGLVAVGRGCRRGAWRSAGSSAWSRRRGCRRRSGRR